MDMKLQFRDSRDQKIVYVIGPYRAQTEWGVVQNIRKAEAVAVELWKLGFAVICPQKNTALFGGAADDSVWLEGDKTMLLRCDAGFLVEGWEQSRGSLDEVALARRNGIPLFTSLFEIQCWAKAPDEMEQPQYGTA